MAFHISSIITNKDSLWVKWIHTYRLNNKSFWQVPIPWDASISWRRILSIREDFRPFFNTEIGNGSRAFFWYDKWLPVGCLSDRITPRDIHNMGSVQHAGVSDFCHQDQINWPPDLLLKYPELESLDIVLNESVEDRVVWVSRDGKKLSYKASTVWEDFRDVNPLVVWCHLTWFSNSIPSTRLFCG